MTPTLLIFVRRVGISCIVLLGVSMLIFAIARIIPGDPARIALGPSATAESVAKLRAELRLDETIAVQYGHFLSELAQGDLGISLYTNRPVVVDIAQFLPATLELIFVAGAMMIVIGLPLGIASARWRGTWIDNAIRMIALLGVSAPSFVWAVILMLLFAYFLPLFPIAGRISDTYAIQQVTGFLFLDTLIAGNLNAFGNAAWHIILPAFALALSGIGQTARLTRANMVETYDKPYIEMAHSYGVPDRRIANRYAFKPSLIPSLTIIGLDFAAMLGNAFLVEAVFAWPGTLALRRLGHPAQGPGCHRRHGAHHLGDLPDHEPHRRCAGHHHQPAHPLRARADMRRAVTILASNPLSLLGLILVGIILICAIFADFIAPFPEHRGTVVDFANFNQPPRWPHLMGTDLVGRDLFSRVIYAYRISLILGVVVLGIAVPVGVTVGLIAGYFGRYTEFALMRVTDVFLSIPPLVLAMSIMGVLEPTLINGMLAVTAMWWPWYARLVYNMTRGEKEEGYVLAAELIGASRLHVMFREVLPNCFPSIVTKMTLDLGFIILIASSLSFLGLGVQPPTPDLGSMVADGAKYLPDSWWLTIFPSLAILIAVFGFNLIGDALRELFGADQ